MVPRLRCSTRKIKVLHSQAGLGLHSPPTHPARPRLPHHGLGSWNANVARGAWRDSVVVALVGEPRRCTSHLARGAALHADPAHVCSVDDTRGPLGGTVSKLCYLCRTPCQTGQKTLKYIYTRDPSRGRGPLLPLGSGRLLCSVAGMQIFRPVLLACFLMVLCAGRVGVGAEEVPAEEWDRQMQDTGLRWLMPVNDEVMHTDALNMIIEVFLPPTGDYNLGIVLSGNTTDIRPLSCSWDCPDGMAPVPQRRSSTICHQPCSHTPLPDVFPRIPLPFEGSPASDLTANG